MGVDEAGDDGAAADVDPPVGGRGRRGGPDPGDRSVLDDHRGVVASVPSSGSCGDELRRSPVTQRRLLMRPPTAARSPPQQRADVAEHVPPARDDDPPVDHARCRRRRRSRRAAPAPGSAPAVRGVSSADGDEVGARPGLQPPGVGPAERRAAVSASSSVAGANRPRSPRREPLVHLQAARLLEQVDDGVLVAAEARAGTPASRSAAGGAEAVGEVALGGRAQADAGRRRAEQARCRRGQVRRVHGRGGRAEQRPRRRAARSG